MNGTDLLSNEARTREEMVRLARRFKPFVRSGTGYIGSTILKAFAPFETRRIVRTESGVRLYLHPFTQLGKKVLLEGEYERDTVQIFRTEVHRGMHFLDLGANEGYFSALGGVQVGDEGSVVAVEPQSELGAIIEINCRLNGVRHFQLVPAVLDASTGRRDFHVGSEHFTGDAALAIHTKFSRPRQVDAVTFADLLSRTPTGRFDFVKMDIEGAEFKVIPSLLPHLRAGRIGKLLLDFHSYYRNPGDDDAVNLNRQIQAAGMRIKPSVYWDGSEDRLRDRSCGALYEWAQGAQ